MNCPQCGKRMKGDWPDKSRWFNCANCRDRFFLEDDGELVNVLFRSRKNERTWFSWISFLARRLDTTLIAVSTLMSSSSVTALLGLDSLIGGSSFLRTCVVLLSSVPTGGKPVF